MISSFRGTAGALEAALLALVAGVVPGAASAQWTLPANRPAYEAVPRRIKSARVLPSPLRLSVGDPVQVRVELLDDAGQPLTVKLPDGRSVPPAFYLSGQGFTRVTGDEELYGSDSPGLRIVGTRPSQLAKIMSPIGPNGPPGRFEYRSLPVPIIVTERAAERIALRPVTFEP